MKDFVVQFVALLLNVWGSLECGLQNWKAYYFPGLSRTKNNLFLESMYIEN